MDVELYFMHLILIELIYFFSLKLFKSFQHLGWSLGVKGTRQLVDNLRTNYDSLLKKMQTNIEVVYKLSVCVCVCACAYCSL